MKDGELPLFAHSVDALRALCGGVSALATNLW